MGWKNNVIADCRLKNLKSEILNLKLKENSMGEIIKKKIWMGTLLVPLVILLIALGPPLVLVFMVLLATFFGLREFYTLSLPHSNGVEPLVGIGLGLALSVIIAYGDIEVVSPLFVLLLLFLSILFLATSQNLPSTISDMGIMLFGIFYIAFLLSHVSLIRNRGDGREWVLFLIATVWAGDIFAFLSGSLFGRHKLYPKISPNKTYEGLGGGILGSIMVALAFALLFIPKLEMGFCVLLGVGLGVLGQLGDFTESMLKRSAQVKDSGSLIPGHGGMLDRLDSFLFSAPFLHYSLLYLLKETP
jgi:phosphatidate cytidylyltransferase